MARPFVKVPRNDPDTLSMTTLSSVNSPPSSPGDLQAQYDLAVAKKIKETITLEGQAALTLISAVPIVPENTGTALNEKV